jgi:DNA-directed RNA polymerase beta subunit
MEDAVILSRRLVQDDTLTSINIKDYKNVLGGRPEVLTPEEFVEKYLK